jgi:sugar lactone lactonase YvrE
MRRSLILLATVVVVALIMTVAGPVAADAPEFPDFTVMEAGPEGVAVDNVGNVYVSVGVEAGHTELWKFDPVGVGTLFTTLPGPSPAGLAMDANGQHVYAAQQFIGVFKVDMDGVVTLVPGTDAIEVPNSLAFDKKGNLYITETYSFDADDGLGYYPNCDFTGVPDGPPFDGDFGRGGIWVVPKGGEAELLLRHDLLTGVCAPVPIPFPIGANGLAYRHGSLIVANTEKALLLEIPVLKRGGLGDISIIADLSGIVIDGFTFGPPMIDGIALDVHGNIYAAMITGNAIVRVSQDGATSEVLATDTDGLTFPASLAFGTGKGERSSVFVTNLAFDPYPPFLAGPGLTKIDVGRPGMPLP